MFQKQITPATIGTIAFRIPLYQRPYAWEEPQVSQLLTDLYDAFVESRKSGTISNSYHIGILSVAQTLDDETRYDLIDGQQRITTLMLIGMAARCGFRKWQEFIDSDRLDLYGRAEDKKFLLGDPGANCNKRMAETVRYAQAFLDLKDDSHEFSEYIYRFAAFFIAEVPSSYSLLDKNQQFVRMNNRGKQLEKHEILKVQLLTVINDEGERTNAFSIWNDMVACLTGIDDGQQDAPKLLRDILAIKDPGNEPAGDEILYTSMLKIPEFLLLALARFLAPEEKAAWTFKTDKLLETFSILNDEKRIIAFSKVLQKQVEIFRSFFIFLSKQEKYEFGGRSDTEDKDFNFGMSQIGKKRLIAVQSFLHVSTEPHHWMIDAFNWCQSQIRPINSEEFTKELERIDNSLNNSDEPNWNRKLIPIDDPGKMNYGSVSHYWFYRLDYELWKHYFNAPPEGTNPNLIWAKLPKGSNSENKAIRGLVENFRFRRCGSIEHIEPQNTIDAPNVQPDHTFGNLALISSSRNSKFSNNPPSAKRALILQSQQPYTESLKMLHFLWCDPTSASHGKAMFEILNHARK